MQLFELLLEKKRLELQLLDINSKINDLISELEDLKNECELQGLENQSFEC